MQVLSPVLMCKDHFTENAGLSYSIHVNTLCISKMYLKYVCLKYTSLLLKIKRTHIFKMKFFRMPKKMVQTWGVKRSHIKYHRYICSCDATIL